MLMTQNSTKIKIRAKNLLHEVKLLEQNLPRLEAKAKYGESAKDRRIASEGIPSTMALIKSKKEEYANLNKLGEWDYA